MKRKLAIASVTLLVLVSALTGFIIGTWWHSNSQRARWDSTALRAKFLKAYMEGDQGKENPIFFYQVENTTDRDYLMKEASEVQLFVKDNGALDSWLGPGLAIDLPIFIPAHDKANVTVHFKVVEREQPKSASASDVQQFLSDKERMWNNYEAIVLLDYRYRYRIEFSIGSWNTMKKP